MYCVSVPLCLHGGQRTTLWTQFSPGSQTQKVILDGKHLHMLSQPTAPLLPNLQSAGKFDNFPYFFFLRMIFRSWRQLFLTGWWQLLAYVLSLATSSMYRYFCSPGDWSQGLVCVRQALCRWAKPSSATFGLLSQFSSVAIISVLFALRTCCVIYIFLEQCSLCIIL